MGAYIAQVFESDDVLSMLRTVQAIVSHLARFPKARAIAAALRASHFGSYSYAAIKGILQKGLDFVPLVAAPRTAPLLAARFSRPVAELLPTPAKTARGRHEFN